MKTIREMAEEYAMVSRYPSAQNIRRDAYLAGAKAMNEMAATVADQATRVDLGEVAHDIRSLIPDS